MIPASMVALMQGVARMGMFSVLPDRRPRPRSALAAGQRKQGTGRDARHARRIGVKKSSAD